MKVSCIMPTFNRRRFIPLALKSYFSQDWPEKELVVIDDGTDKVEDLFAGVESCKYVRLSERMTIGAKRNLACEAATGEIIAHWDDDDWSASTRISEQVKRLLDSGKSVTGYHDLLFWYAPSAQASKYRNADIKYSCGTALCYFKSWWAGHRFKSISNGEDNQFVGTAKKADAIISVPAGQTMVAQIHPNSTNKRYNGSYPFVAKSEIPAAFFAALEQ